MTREEAIEVVKKNWPDSRYTSLREALEILIPELRESEDERIRRVIRQLLLGMREEIFTTQDEIVTKAKVFAYLEKQKENPQSADSIPADCVSDVKCGNSRHKVGDSLEGRKLADEVVAYLIKSGYQPIIKDTLDQKHFQIKIPRHKEDFFQSKEYKHCREILDEYYYEGDFAGDVYTLYVLRQKEQKPWKVGENAYFTPDKETPIAEQKLVEGDNETEIQKAFREGKSAGRKEVFSHPEEYGLQKPAEWSDTNELVFKDICKHLKEEGYNGWIVLLNALRNGEFQPKQEWSEEDEKIQQDIQYALRYAYFNNVIGKQKLEYTMSWLESLPERFNLQPKQEWGKEDGRIIDTIVSVLSQYIDYKTVSGPSSGSAFATPRYSKEIDWLNSLRPSWKPSEEQIDRLFSIIAALRKDYCDDMADFLANLRADLKKLGVKEEPEYYQHFDPDC